jgi:hypothetical protein
VKAMHYESKNMTKMYVPKRAFRIGVIRAIMIPVAKVMVDLLFHTLFDNFFKKKKKKEKKKDQLTTKILTIGRVSTVPVTVYTRPI